MPSKSAGRPAGSALLAVDRQRAGPGADLGEALGVEGDAGALAHDVALLLHDLEGALPGQVGREPLGLLQHHPDLLQRLDHLEAVAADLLVQPVVVDLAAEVDRGLLVAAGDEEEGVLGAQVGVVAHAGDDEDVTGAVVGVEVAAVVEVPVAGSGPADRLRDLVEGVLVERAEPAARAAGRAHQAPTFARTDSSSGLQWKSDSMSAGISISPKCTWRAPVRMKTMHHCSPL